MESGFSCREWSPWKSLEQVRYREGSGRLEPEQFLEIPFKERGRDAIPDLYFVMLRDSGADHLFPRLGLADGGRRLQMQEVELVFAETTRSIRLWTLLDEDEEDLEDDDKWWPRQLMLMTRALFQGEPLTHPFPLPEVPGIFNQIAFVAPGFGFPKDAVEAVMASPEVYRQPFQEVLRWLLDLRPEDRYALPERYLLHIYALEFLCYWNDPEVKPLVLQLAQLEEATCELLFGDFWTELIAGWLLCVGGVNPEALGELLCDRSADPWGRAASIEVLRHLHLTQRLETQTYKGLLERALLKLPEEMQKPRWQMEFVWAELAYAATEFPEFHQNVRAALQRGWIDEEVYGPNEYRLLMEGKQEREYPLVRVPHPIENLQLSACFSTNTPQVRVDRDDELAALDELDTLFSEAAFDEEGESEGRGFEPGLGDFDRWEPPQPYRRETPKVGRNEPCPCGSGKKFKKCCGMP